MIRYTVVWHEDAQNELARIWMATTSREAVSQATGAIDSHLCGDAESKGRSVEGDLRELVVPPLRVLFSVSEPDRLARIVHVAALPPLAAKPS